jgi:hypothetical protein
MFDITQFRTDIVTPTLDALQIRGKEFIELLVFTCAVESAGGTYVKQNKGTALGIYQLEPSTFTDLWHNYILRKPDVVNLLSLNLSLHRVPDPIQLITDLSLATVCCVLFYKWKKVQINSIDENHLWEIYKEFYNTPLGKSEKEPSLKAYRKFTKL